MKPRSDLFVKYLIWENNWYFQVLLENTQKGITVIYSLLIPLLVNWVSPELTEAPKFVPFEQNNLESTESVCPCTLTQGNTVVPFPLFSDAQSAINFYSYGVPVGASSNTGFELADEMLFFLYENTLNGDISFITVIDAPNNGTGGTANIEYNCLPATAFVELSDDPGELSGNPPTITGNFAWNGCCTDGGIIGGVGCGTSFSINPNSLSGVNGINFIHGSPGSPQYINLPPSECTIYINCGGNVCCDNAFNLTTSVQDADCIGTPTGSIDLTLDCASGVTFLWSTGATTEDLINITPGNYSVTVSDVNGCSETASFTVGVANPPPQPVINGPTEFCAGTFAFLSVTGGSFISYQWSTGQTDPSISVTLSGTYSVTVTDVNGCEGSASITVTENPTPQPNITGPTLLCPGATATLDAGGGFSSYSWSTGDQTQTVDISNPGGYSVTVTNSFGCQGVDLIIVQPTAPLMVDVTGPSSFCEGETVTLTADPGFQTYNWSNGGQTQTIDVTTGGGYSVSVTDNTGCLGIGFIVVEMDTLPEPEILGPTQICPGEVANFTVDLGYDSYAWNSGANTNAISVTDTGTYIVTVGTAAGCEASDSINLIAQPSDSLFLFNTSCNPADTGITVTQLQNQFGCDSLIIETISYSESDTMIIMDASCNPADTGTISATFTNQFGCDSVVIETTILNPSDTLLLFGTSCNPIDTGTTVNSLTNQFGCDSTIIETISYSESDTLFFMDASCNPQDAGLFVDSYVNQFGCDSIEILEVNLLPSDSIFMSSTTCIVQDTGTFTNIYSNQFGCDSLVVEKVNFAEADTTNRFGFSCNPQDTGVFVNTFMNQFGCDSLDIFFVDLWPTDTTLLFSTSCNPADTGITIMTTSNQFGCDSVLIESISFNPTDSTFLFDASCNPQDTGTFVSTFINQFGCDSIVTETISLLPSDSTFLFNGSCNPVDTGVFVMTLLNEFGCDSVVTETITLLPSDTTALQSASCNPQDTGVFVLTLSNQFGCDSTLVETVSLLSSDSTLLTGNSCNPQDTGIFVQSLSNEFGCDSTVVEVIELLLSDTTLLFDASCNPQDTGVFVSAFTNQQGCDSTVIETIDLLPESTTQLFDLSCNPQDTGVFVNVYANQYGCDSVVTETIGLLPSNEVALFNVSCSPQDTGVFVSVFTNQFGCDSVVTETISLLPSNTTNLFATSCSPQDTGVFVTNFLNQFGCDSTVIETVNLLPSQEIMIQSSSCNPQDTGTFVFNYQNQFGCDSVEIEVVTLDPTDSTFFFTGTCNPLDTGVFITNLTNQYGCDSLLFDVVELLPIDSCGFEIMAGSNPVDCFGASSGSISLTVMGGASPFEYSWTGPTMGSGTWTDPTMPLLLSDLSAGTFTFLFIDANGYEWTGEVTVDSPTVLDGDIQIDSDFFGFPISCAGGADGAISVNVTGGTAPYQYAWSTGGNTSTLVDLSAGTYEVTVTDANGCIFSQAINLNEPQPLSAAVEVLQPTCLVPALVRVNTISGGIEPYLIALGDNAFASVTSFSNVPAGQYSVEVMDAAGCTWVTDVLVEEQPELVLDLGPDTLIRLGDQLLLTWFSNANLVDSVNWMAFPSTDFCDTCANPVVSPEETTEFHLWILDENGCVAEDQRVVRVDTRPDIFIPNAISPDGNGRNDRFTLYAGRTVKEVRSMRIFSRWGEALYQRFNFPPNDPSFGWDGTHRGQELNAGVYVYQFEVEYIDGTTEVLKGDVTLVK